MFLEKGKFEFGYDLLRHSTYCIVHEIVIEASKKRDHTEARFQFERLFYDRRRLLTKVKLKTYSTFSYRVALCIKEIFFYELSKSIGREAQGRAVAC